jgi:hypothetical protein
MPSTKLTRVLVLAVFIVSLTRPARAFADPSPPHPPAAATPAPSGPPPAPIINLVFRWDFGVIAEAVQKALQDVFGGIAGGIQQHVLDPLVGSSLNFLTRTPPEGTYANPIVVALWGYSRDVALAGFVVLVVIAGYQIMTSGAIATPYAGALATLRDALVGLLLATTSLWWTSVTIDLGNALASGVGGVALPTIGQTGFAGLALETIVLGLVYLIMGILLVLQMLVRLALLDILLIVAPLAILVGALPAARHWTRLWADLFVGTLLTQFVQILALRLGTGLLTQLVPSLADDVLTFLAGIAVLWLVLKVPGLLHAGLHRAGGSATLVGTALSAYGVSRVIGVVGGAGAARSVGAGSASSAGTAASSSAASRAAAFRRPSAGP